MQDNVFGTVNDRGGGSGFGGRRVYSRRSVLERQVQPAEGARALFWIKAGRRWRVQDQAPDRMKQVWPAAAWLRELDWPGNKKYLVPDKSPRLGQSILYPDASRARA